MKIDHFVERGERTVGGIVDKPGGDETYQTTPQHPHSPLRISSPLSRTVTKV